MSTKETLDICFLVGSQSRHSNHWMLWIRDTSWADNNTATHGCTVMNLDDYTGFCWWHTACLQVSGSAGHVRGHSSITVQVICTQHGFIILMCHGVCVCRGGGGWNMYTYILSSSVWQDVYLNISLVVMCTNTFCLCVSCVSIHLMLSILCMYLYFFGLWCIHEQQISSVYRCADNGASLQHRTTSLNRLCAVFLALTQLVNSSLVCLMLLIGVSPERAPH